MPTAAGTRWVFTLNNPAEDRPDLSFAKCAVWQKEKAPTTGTIHLQGYLELPSRLTHKQLKEKFPGAFLELARGSRDQCKEYCTKEESRVDGPWEIGDWAAGGQGKRSDLAEVKRMLDSGATELEVADNHFGDYVRYHKAFAQYRQLRVTARSEKTEVHVYWGDPGTGKSKKALEDNPGAYWKARGNWWDGYDQQATVVLDDFYGWLPFDMLLRLLDRYPLNVEVKGGTRVFNSKRIVITSNKHPSEWYHSENICVPALYRRIDKVLKYSKLRDGTTHIEEQQLQ